MMIQTPQPSSINGRLWGYLFPLKKFRMTSVSFKNPIAKINALFTHLV